MKIDCNKTEEFFKEWERFCHTQMACNLCELNSSCVSWRSKAEMFSRSSEFAEGIQKWSDEHPQITILEELLTHYPDTKLTYKDKPSFRPCEIGIVKKVLNNHNLCIVSEHCNDCWDRINE